MASNAAAGPSRAPTKPPVVIPSGGGKNIIISPTQRGNPVLECVRNVGREFGDIVADYQVGRTTGLLYLSLKYHRLHPEYIHTRIEKLGHSYNLRLLLIQCDVSEHREPIRELTKTCLINNITIITAFSLEDAGHYISTFKQFEHKPPDMIKERIDKSYPAILRNALTSINKVNKTDVETLRTSFGSFASISKATPAQLQSLPGFGQVKVKNIHNAFEKPLRNQGTNALPSTLPAAGDSTQTNTPSSPTGPPPNARPSAATAAVGASGGTNATSLGSGQAAATAPSRVTQLPGGKPFEPRASSPDWDIELDLNSSDVDL